MKISFIDSINDIPQQDWNRVAGVQYPFTRHEFLSALENYDCLGEKWGWFPRHLTAYREGQLVAAIPLYLKTNSYGELVFDGSWADAYQRTGLPYYPKLVSAIPYTPATGSRLLLDPTQVFSTADQQQLIHAVTDYVRQHELSSMHWLFPDQAQTELLKTAGLLIRTGCQFHWENQGYRDFTDYLSTLSAKKRKNIKRERRHVQEAGITIRQLQGHEASEQEWAIFHQLYASTFDRKSGWATLSLAFFLSIARSMGQHILLILCYEQDRAVAASLCFKSDTVLYGRHWGCNQAFHSLHFEACYYQGLNYCIDHQLQRFDPGAQCEHKISRGFLPAPTYSAHWLAHPGFERIIQDYLVQETQAMDDYMLDMMQHSPFKGQQSTCQQKPK